MNSIFNLKRNPAQLDSSNEKVADYYFREVQSIRNIQDGSTVTEANNFGTGEISLRWTLDNRTWWMPSRSFVKIRVKLSKTNGDTLEYADDIAPNMGLAGNLFQRAQLKMNDQTVDSIDNYLAEIDVLKNRIHNGGDWMNQIGNSINFWNSNQRVRQADVVSDGFLSNYLLSSDPTANVGAPHIGYEVFDNSVLLFTAGNTVEQNEANNALRFAVGAGLPLIGTFPVLPGDIFIYKITAEANFRFIRIVADSIPGSEWFVASNDRLGHGALAFEVNTIRLIRYTSATAASSWNAMAKADYGPTGQVHIVNPPSLYAIRTATNVDLRNTFQKGDFYTGQGQAGGFNRCYIGYDLDVITNVVLTTINHGIINTAGGGGATGVPFGVAAAEAIDLYIRYGSNNTQTQFLGPVELGLGKAPAAYVSWAVDANGVLTFTPSVAGITIPDANALWKPYDLIVVGDTGGTYAGRKRYYMVLNVINTTQIQVMSSTQIEVAGGANAHIIGRWRMITKPPVSTAANQFADISRKVSEFDICWNPKCLGVFNVHHAIPGGTKFELLLNPWNNSSYQVKGVETPTGVQKLFSDVNNPNRDFLFKILDLRFYICQMQGPIIQADNYYLDLHETRCHNLPLLTEGQTQNAIDIVSSSYAITLAFQDSRAGTRTDISNSKFKLLNEEEKLLERYSIRFGGRSLPDPDAQIIVNENIQNIVDYYTRNHLYGGSYNQLTQESLNDWFERGIYFHHPFYRTALNKETRAYIITKFNSNLIDNSVSSFTERTRMLIFEHYHRVVIVSMDKGRVINVTSSNT